MKTPRIEERFQQVIAPYDETVKALRRAADHSMHLKRTIIKPDDVRVDISDQSLPFSMRFGTSSAQLTEAQDGLKEELRRIGIDANIHAEVPRKSAMDSRGRVLSPKVIDAISRRGKDRYGSPYVHLRAGDFSRVVQLPGGEQESLYDAFARRWFSRRNDSLSISGATYVEPDEIKGKGVIAKAREAGNRGWLHAPLTARMKAILFPDTTEPDLHHLEEAFTMNDWIDGEMNNYSGPVIGLARTRRTQHHFIIGMGELENGQFVKESEMFIERRDYNNSTDVNIEVPSDFPGGYRGRDQYGANSGKHEIWFLTSKAQES